MKIGPMELIIILLIVVMIFGVGKLPQAASSLGKAMKEFRKESQRDDDDEVEEAAPRKKRTATTRKPSAVKATEKAPVVETPKETTATAPAKTTVKEKGKAA
jgi:sec-independent protein translocase protein TatA